MPKTKRAKPIIRQLVRTDHEEIQLYDLGASLKELQTTVDGLIAKYGIDAQVEFDGPDYEGPDHLKVYTTAMETDEQFAKRRKKIVQMRKIAKASAKRRAAASAKLEAEVRQRSLQAATAEQDAVDAVQAARLREPFAK